jgi:hypothetical protein
MDYPYEDSRRKRAEGKGGGKQGQVTKLKLAYGQIKLLMLESATVENEQHPSASGKTRGEER